MSKSAFPFLLAALFISGCSLFSVGGKDSNKGKVTINWQCERDGNSRTQTCQKRRMRNGKPVDSEIFETIVIPGDVPLEQVTGSGHTPPENAGNAVPWRRQPLSSVNTIEDPEPLNVENLGPELRKVRNTADVWGKPSPEKRRAQAPGDGKDGDGLAGYTLQMAAFTSSRRCDTFITRHQSGDLPVYKRTITSKQTRWCIVTHGAFASPAEANAASRKFAEKYPKLSFWVRSWDSIRELEVTE